MKLLRHPVAALVIFVIVLGLYVTTYSDLGTSYDFTDTDYKIVHYASGDVNGTITEHLQQLTIIEAIQDIQEAILKLNTPFNLLTGFDIIGALVTVGLSAIKAVVGLIVFPFDILTIIITFYTELPPMLTQLTMILVVYVGFILASLYFNRGEF